MRELIISENEANQRLDKFLAKYIRLAPMSFCYKMLRKKNIVLNGRKASGNERLVCGDAVKLFLSDDTIEKFRGASPCIPCTLESHMPEILYEDRHVLLLNKPVGMLSQKARPGDISVAEYVEDYLLRSGQAAEESLRAFHPGICNRLDRNTSGLMAAGKSLAGLQELSRGFKERSFRKLYLCMVTGRIEGDFHITGYLTKDEKQNRVSVCQSSRPSASPIETGCRPIAKSRDATLLEVCLITGKTHQIRAHLAAMGHPLIGDYKYGDRKVNDWYKRQYGLKSQLLHSYRLEFPRLEGALKNLSGRSITAEAPELFDRIIRRTFGEISLGG